MNLKKLSHRDLDSKLKSLVQQERELLSEVLTHIQECDRRRLFLEMGYPNLFSYLTKHVGYSEGAAQRRIDAARLMAEIPEVKEKIESGRIQLSQISQIQKVSRQKLKETARRDKSAAQKEIVQGMKNQAISLLELRSSSESEQILAELFEMPIQEQTKMTRQKNESVRIEFTLSQKQAEKLQAVKEVLSHLVPDGNLPEVFEYLMDQLLTRKRAAAVAAESKSQEMRKNKTITEKTRRIVLQRDQCCQVTSDLTGRKCGSRWQLEVDHIQSQWAQGDHDIHNLRAVCGQHNRHKYRKESGVQFI